MAMRRSNLRSGWGLALAVLFGGSLANAQPPAMPTPPPRVTQTVYPPSGNTGVPTSLPPVGTTLPPAATALPPTPVPVPHTMPAPSSPAPGGNHGMSPGSLNSQGMSHNSAHNG